ncbi:MAG: N-acetylglucosamine-6-phosphate deacetylase [Sulfobacillus sp.]
MSSLRGRIFLDSEQALVPGVVHWDGKGQIERIEHDPQAQTGPVILPGFIDEHIHGIGGLDTMDREPGRFDAMSRAVARHGVTGFLATTLTAPLEDLRRIIEDSRSIALGPLSGARLWGLHLEGPFIDPIFKGAQPANAIAAPLVASAQYLMGDNRDQWVRLITMAPNMPGAGLVIEWMRQHGVAVNLGHSSATFDEGKEGVLAGADGLTHFFNAMSPLNHREPGLVGLGLTEPRLWCELIADGIHIRPEILAYVFHTMAERVLLITDAMAAADMPDGDYQLGGSPVTVSHGAARLNDGTLAGSVLTLDQALRNLLRWGIPLQSIVSALSGNPARRLGLFDRGAIASGMRADLVVLDNAYNVEATYCEGRPIFDARPILHNGQ